MSTPLNITNGDCAVEAMTRARILGDFLRWGNVLHEGPGPTDLSGELTITPTDAVC